ncbi:MAG: methylamine dehydrogenase accessory protein MauD [Pseudohongiellaceae bacterium]
MVAGVKTMLEALLVSNIVLWILVVVLSLLVLALSRQVGILHERVAPAGALMPTNGPKVGELTQEISLKSIHDEALIIGGASTGNLASFILFISPTCPVCKSLVPTAKSLVNSERNRMQLLFASDGDALAQHQRYAKDLDLGDYPYVLSEALGRAFEVSKLPFAVLIGADGILKGKGLVNTREHMESLIESMDSGVVSVQEYIGSIQNEQEDTEPSAMEHTS